MRCLVPSLVLVLLASTAAAAESPDDSVELGLTVKQWSLQRTAGEGAAPTKVEDCGAVPEIGARVRFSAASGTLIHQASLNVSEGRLRYEGSYVDGPALTSDTRLRALAMGYQLSVAMPGAARTFVTLGGDVEERRRGVWNPTSHRTQDEKLQFGVLRVGLETDSVGPLRVFGGAGLAFTLGARMRIDGDDIKLKTDALLCPRPAGGGYIRIGAFVSTRVALELTHERLAFGASQPVSVTTVGDAVASMATPRTTLDRTGIRLVYRF